MTNGLDHTEMSPAVRVILFPGLGADERLFAPQRAAFPGVVEVPPRFMPQAAREPLSLYAARLAQALGLLPPARPHDHRARLILGGSSFGSMLAVELARIVKPDALVVVGGAPARSGIPALFRLGARAAMVLPTFAFAPMLVTGDLIAPLFGARTREERRLFSAMLRACPLAFTAWAIRAIGSWRPAPLEGTAVHVVHGARDHILPARRAAKGAHIVEGAGHLLTWTHAEDVNRFLAAVIAHPR